MFEEERRKEAEKAKLSEIIAFIILIVVDIIWLSNLSPDSGAIQVVIVLIGVPILLFFWGKSLFRS